VLEEAGDNGVAWVAGAEDDAGLREQRGNEAELENIVGHFIDDARGVPGFCLLGAQVGFGLGAQALRCPRGRRRPADARSGGTDAKALASAENLGMAGGDLLEQGGAGARHAGDEDWRLR